MTDAAAKRSPIACRVCRSRRSAYLCETPNVRKEPRRLAHFRCLECGSLFVGTDISAEELSHAYATMNEAAYYRETAFASAPKYFGAARELQKIVSTSASVLDIGGGNGTFIRVLAAHGFQNLSIQEIPSADLRGLESFACKIYRDTNCSTVPSACFDAAVMMDVMEHVPDPASAMSAARRVLRPGGILYLHTPIVTVLDRIMHGMQKLPLVGRLGPVWQQTRTSIFHLQLYTISALARLVEAHGFEVVELRRINELSWPVLRYVRVYLVRRYNLPRALMPLLVLMLRPLLRSRLNANKAVLVARRCG